jgi:hypothetical protein
MKITETLHPEVLLGKRGHPSAIELYKHIRTQTKMGEHGNLEIDQETAEGRFLAALGTRDPVFGSHMRACKHFLGMSGKTYYLPKEFVEALSKIDRDIPIEYLPKRFAGYFHFAKGSMADDGGRIYGGYVYIIPFKEVNYKLDEGEVEPESVIGISYMNPPHEVKSTDEDQPGVYAYTMLIAPLTKEKIAEIADRLPQHDVNPPGFIDPTSSEERKELRLAPLRAFINAVLYVNSQDPELQNLRPLPSLSVRERKEHVAKMGGNANECTIPVTLLNWSYGQERRYGVDSTFVQKHMRWQPCGPEKSQVKLIWVREHERHYKKEEPVKKSLMQRLIDGAAEDNHPLLSRVLPKNLGGDKADSAARMVPLLKQNETAQNVRIGLENTETVNNEGENK